MTNYTPTDNEKKFIQLLKDRKKESETNDDVFCALLTSINIDEDGEEFFYIDKALEWAKSNPKASLAEICDFIISLRPNDDLKNNKEAV